MKLLRVFSAILLASLIQPVAIASETSRLAELEQEISEIKESLLEKAQSDKAKEDAAEEKAASSIKVGGAVRFQYSYEDYDNDNSGRGGDADFDVFWLNVDGTINDITLSAQYRFYQYMNVIHHADLAYQFTEHWQGKIGITKVPFGNLPWNSNNFFFSTNYYLGLEDDYDAGIVFNGDYGNHEINLAYFKNDEMGGIDGYVSGRTDRYSYDIVGTRAGGEGLFDTPTEALAEDSQFNLRYVYNYNGAEVGVSALYGDIEGESGGAGDHNAYAFHVKSQIDNVGIMFQYTNYEYNLDEGSDLIAVGAWAFYDTIPTSAEIYNLNLSYSWDVDLGPVSNLKFYNDFNLMTNKSGDFNNDTVMNVTGVQATAGNLYVVLDFIQAQNQPFIGGSLAGDSDDTNSRVNMNFGFYF